MTFSSDPLGVSRPRAVAIPGAAADVVEIRLPASTEYLAFLRMATAALTARLNFTLDEIEDLRIAVSEACSMLLNQTPPEAELTCRFLGLPDGTLTIEVSAPTINGVLPATGTFAWTVLSALAGSVAAAGDADNRVTLFLRKDPT